MSTYDAQAFLELFLVIFAATFVITMAVTFVAIAVMYVVLAIALMGFFRKVGVESWIAWVPYYRMWKWLEIGGQKGWLSLLGLIPFGDYVTSIYLWIGMHRTGIAFRQGEGFLVLGIFFPCVWAFILGSSAYVYEPHLITQAGYPPPLAGYGSAPSYSASGGGAPGAQYGGYAPYPTPNVMPPMPPIPPAN